MKRLALVLLLAACGKDATPAPKVEPLPPKELALDLGRQPIINPLNLWDLMIEGATALDVVGTVAGQPVTTDELDARTGQALTRIGERIYDARDAGWRWLVEREGLRRAAGDAGIAALLAGETEHLPAPDDAALAPYLRRDDVAALAGDDQRAAAVTLWRWDAWRIRRSVLIQRGLDGVTVGRRQLMLIQRELTLPGATVGDLGDRQVTRTELHLAAGYPEQLARREYVDAAKIAFDEVVAERLLAGVKIPPSPSLTAKEIDAYIAAHPEYATATNGRGRAKADLETLRAVETRDALIATLSREKGVYFDLQHSAFEPISPDVDAPRVSGAGPHRLEVLHCAGTATCALGVELTKAILSVVGDDVTLLAGDYFEQPRLTTVRGALAMRCAEEQHHGWDLAIELAGASPAASLAELEAHAAAIHLDAAAFHACLASDRWLPMVAENVARAQVLGMELNMVGIWVDGVRVENLADPRAAVAEVRALVQK